MDLAYFEYLLIDFCKLTSRTRCLCYYRCRLCLEKLLLVLLWIENVSPAWSRRDDFIEINHMAKTLYGNSGNDTLKLVWTRACKVNGTTVVIMYLHGDFCFQTDTMRI